MASTQNLHPSLKEEWLSCPKCSNQLLTPMKSGKDQNGNVRVWWICTNHKSCGFPLAMPPKVYHVTQSMENAKDRLLPLPRIFELPSSLHFLYPKTFNTSNKPYTTKNQDSESTPCYLSTLTNPANQKNGEFKHLRMIRKIGTYDEKKDFRDILHSLNPPVLKNTGIPAEHVQMDEERRKKTEERAKNQKEAKKLAIQKSSRDNVLKRLSKLKGFSSTSSGSSYALSNHHSSSTITMNPLTNPTLTDTHIETPILLTYENGLDDLSTNWNSMKSKKQEYATEYDTVMGNPEILNKEQEATVGYDDLEISLSDF